MLQQCTVQMIHRTTAATHDFSIIDSSADRLSDQNDQHDKLQEHAQKTSQVFFGFFSTSFPETRYSDNVSPFCLKTNNSNQNK